MFGNFFKKSESEEKDLGKIILNNDNQLDTIINNSIEKPVLLFKHSTRCGISSMVLKRFDAKLMNIETEFEYYFLDLLAYRNISNLIAEKFGVHHQSPQLIVFKNGKVFDAKSHYDILDVTF